MVHLLLLKWHPMAGLDIHSEITATPVPVPAPDIPHLVAQTMYGFGGATISADKIKANGWNLVLRDSDISYGIPHVPLPPYPPCLLVLTWMALSGSKAYFGPSSVVSTGNAPIAAALLLFANLQLNCDEPLPMPTGRAISWSSVMCGMTWGDIIGGFLAMGFDMLISWVLNKLGDGIAGKLLGKTVDKLAIAAVKLTVGIVLQQLTGSPVGYTWSLPQHIAKWLGAPNDGAAASPGNWGTLGGHKLGSLIDSASGERLGSPAPSPATSPQSAVTHDPGVEQH